MKKWLLILFLFLLPGFAALAQNDEEPAQEAGKIQEKMREYIQVKLGLSKAESEKFSPIFVRYFREFVQTHRQNKNDRLVLQQKIIELRLRYRGEFRQIMDEQRANKVYHYEDEFRRKAAEIIRENRRDRIQPRRTRTVIYR
ncbi:MAG: hypothetical protein V9F01_16980 [Chitinophagaceae bacterium]